MDHSSPGAETTLCRTQPGKHDEVTTRANTAEREPEPGVRLSVLMPLAAVQVLRRTVPTQPERRERAETSSELAWRGAGGSG